MNAKNCKAKYFCLILDTPSKKRLCPPAQLRRASPTPIRWITWSFLAFWCIVIEIAGEMRRFTFLVSDVSISSIYSPLQMLFWVLMYLHCLDIRFRRCSFSNQSIYNLFFFELADAFHPTYHVQLHLHLTFFMRCGYFLRKFCICIPRFL